MHLSYHITVLGPKSATNQCVRDSVSKKPIENNSPFEQEKYKPEYF